MEQFNLKINLTGKAKTKVSNKNTAARFKSGNVNVYSTPDMVALMELASVNAISKSLPLGYTTVGTGLNIKHISATPIDMEVTAKSVLIKIDGSKLKFKIEAYDDKEKVGEGTHYRYIVNRSKFSNMATKKLDK